MSPIKALLSVCAFSVILFSGTSTAEIYPPDPRFYAATSAVIHFEALDGDIDKTCVNVGVIRTEEYRLAACAGVKTGKWHMWVKNPCGIEESYAKELCHEMAHVNGFRHPEYL